MMKETESLGALDVCLTLPGDIPGLLRRGSPVVFRCGGHVPGTVVKFMDYKGHKDVPVVWWAPSSNPNGVGKPSLWSSILLDLTDATGRAHAAMWLGSDEGLEQFPADGSAPVWVWADSGWWLTALERNGSAHGGYFYWPRDHQHLRDLDPADPRLLPDGSRWVDAEALRRVCLHVAGREISHA